jgi:hypothetical protein
VAASAAGAFVVVWRSGGQDDGGLGGVFGQRFDSTGARQGGEFQVNVYTSGQQDEPTVAMSAAGACAISSVSPARRSSRERSTR